MTTAHERHEREVAAMPKETTWRHLDDARLASLNAQIAGLVAERGAHLMQIDALVAENKLLRAEVDELRAENTDPFDLASLDTGGQP